ncbi:NAD(P)-dependent oxidoreductase [Virgibacillus sp. C22-A2]|uniref:NAD(P)-dependent oxidoreductase n=1 Tax=Virgibacillus tibetensis TaxID=3042313 RepID=A0ABU6KG87_9BACI|nr:NAD(P)-dependent oxidoreductase [Virgibacillus sp. C22-A2]
MRNIGVVGCGLMGRGIVKNLLENNYKVSIYDIDKAAVGRLEEMGATASASVKSMAKEIDCLILSLPSPALVQKTLLEDGAINELKAGSTVLDMSTNDVEITRNLAQHAKKSGIELFDCPLSGGPAGAENGTLTIMVGGNAKAFTGIVPVLKAVGEHIEYVGPSGAGQAVKLCHNMIVGGVITLLSEALLTGEKAGVPKAKVASILQKGSAHTRVMDVFGSNILEDNFSDIKFSLANMTKDIQLYRNLAERELIPTFASQPSHQIYQLAANKGKGALDATAIYEMLDEWGG